MFRKGCVVGKRRRVVRDAADHRQMVAGGASHAAARLLSADIHLINPLSRREAINQALTVLLLILFPIMRLFIAAMVAGTNTVLLIGGVLRCEITVVAQYLLKR